MQLVRDSAALVSAATDLLLAGIAAAGVGLARRPLWRAAFAGLALASAAGAAVHGLSLSDSTGQALWLSLNLSLGLGAAFFVLAVLRDGAGPIAARRAALPLLLIGSGVALVAQIFPSTFLPFVIFNSLILLAAAASGLHRRRWALAAGCGLALLGGAVQASGLRWQLRWEFDHNSLYHLIQIPALLLWLREARTLPRP